VILKDALLMEQSFLSQRILIPGVGGRVLLCRVLNVDRSYLYSHDDYNMTEEEYKKFTLFLEERIKGKPLQYITGHQEFMSLILL